MCGLCKQGCESLTAGIEGQMLRLYGYGFQGDTMGNVLREARQVDILINTLQI